MRIQVKRVYAPPERGDGVRILVDRLWPRGLSQAGAWVDVWAKDVAPSSALRRWYQHDPEKWPEFRRRYSAELDAHPAGVAALRARLGQGTVTLLFGTKEVERNNAMALRDYLEARAVPRHHTG